MSPFRVLERLLSLKMRMKTANNLLDEIHAVSGVTLSSRMVKKQLQFASLFLHSLGINQTLSRSPRVERLGWLTICGTPP